MTVHSYPYRRDPITGLTSSIVRVQIPVYTDRWMMGDRYGEVVKIVNQIAHVKLDKSGKTLKFVYADCTEV